ncbi:hypothetical protein MJD09_16045 [bacterium]|nr:hypothetical protein [bacterium]
MLTPTEHSAPEAHYLQDIDVARIALIGAADSFSYAYTDQAMGNICDDVCPFKEHAATVGFSQGASLGWHTEDAPYNRDLFCATFDVLSLAYIRNPNQDRTYLSMPVFEEMERSLHDWMRL